MLALISLIFHLSLWVTINCLDYLSLSVEVNHGVRGRVLGDMVGGVLEYGGVYVFQVFHFNFNNILYKNQRNQQFKLSYRFQDQVSHNNILLLLQHDIQIDFYGGFWYYLLCIEDNHRKEGERGGDCTLLVLDLIFVVSCNRISSSLLFSKEFNNYIIHNNRRFEYLSL